MPAVSILTDSTADLSPELVQRHGLQVVPLTVEFGEDEFLDGVNLDSARLFDLVAQRGALPKTASPSPGTYQSAFAAATEGGRDAIYIGISSQFSASLQNARIAGDLLPDRHIHVVDSGNLSTGVGLLTLHACDLAAQGKSADEIEAALAEARPKVRTAFMVDTLEYIYKGGRCSGVTALVGALLKLRPVISVVNGGMVVAAKVRGPRQKGLDWMLERFRTDAAQGVVRPERVFVTHTGVHEDALYLMAEIKRIMPEVQEVLETNAGAVVSSHCGPGTIGVLYMVK